MLSALVTELEARATAVFAPQVSPPSPPPATCVRCTHPVARHPATLAVAHADVVARPPDVAGSVLRSVLRRNGDRAVHRGGCIDRRPRTNLPEHVRARV